MTSYFLWRQERWYQWSRLRLRGWGWVQAGREPNQGGRYPVVILTYDSYYFVMRLMNKFTNPAPDNLNDPVISIKNMQDWQFYWDRAAPYHKLLVYEFYEKNSPVCKAMDKPFENLAKKYKGQAYFCKLDVDNFEFLARLCGVEGAYPTFALLKNGRQVGKVVGPKEEELEQSIKRALN